MTLFIKSLVLCIIGSAVLLYVIDVIMVDRNELLLAALDSG